MLPTPHRPTPHRVPSQIERDIATLKAKLQNEQLPSITNAEAAVHRWTSKAVLDDQFKPDLYAATKAVEAAQQAWAQRARDNTTLSNLQRELDESVATRRIEAAQRAQARLQTSIDEYMHASRLMARAFRALLNAQYQAQQTPGVNTNLSNLRLSQMHIPHLYPMSFGGTLGEGMMGGLQQFERDDGLTKAAA